ncbi:MAG TPA: zinc/manganese transporter permease [Gammaproteobacteria bacterium]|nr:zinc/manganese transporter permease [Gammaproteobacteria bacterium]
MIAGLLVIATHVPLGREVLRRGIIFLDLAIAQTAAFGVVLASTLWPVEHAGHYFSSTGIAIFAAIGGSFILYSTRKLEVRIQESMIGILFVLMATGIILLLSADPHGGERLKQVLVGQILWLQPNDLVSLFIVYSIVLVTWIQLHHKMSAWLFYPLFAVTITLSTQIVGVYLVFASLIIPSLATLQDESYLGKAYAIGLFGYLVGLIASASADLPAGASIVWSMATVAGVYYLLSRALKRRAYVSNTNNQNQYKL